ncbi:MAG: elongation factor Ts [Clostridia bacterium]|nr:elongation factor Ts [Clostridia bacterium]MBR4439261.1 elongation factor Ts [Clostridia bacterium]
MAFTAKDVALLREKTGCGMMDCKKALTESDGDMEKAIEYLREKGIAAAEKKASRIAAEGIIGSYVSEDGKVAALVEVNSETDFVAKNAGFQEFVKAVAATVGKNAPADVEALGAMTIDGGDMTVTDALREKILTIGEKLTIRRFVRYEGHVVTYIHGGGTIGVMVNLDTDDATFAKQDCVLMAKDVAMQIAAMSPTFLDKASVPAEFIEKEKEILLAQAINEGKPQNIAEKMVMGRIAKYYKDICLLEQAFVKNDEINVDTFIKNTAKELGAAVSVKEFVRLEKGEGLEKREDNFAAEVAGMVK